jgi:hypothetical protein
MRNDHAFVDNGQFAPVNRRKHMVGCVVAIVQQQPVRETAGNVARVIEARLEITILVLQQIDSDKEPLPE